MKSTIKLFIFLLILSACGSNSKQQGTFVGNTIAPEPDKIPGKYKVINKIKDYLDYFDLDEAFFDRTCQGSEGPVVQSFEDELLFINFLNYEGELRLLSVDLEALQSGNVTGVQSINPEGYSALCDVQITLLDGNPLIGLACKIYDEDQLLESCAVVAGKESSSEELPQEESGENPDENPDLGPEEDVADGGAEGEDAEEVPDEVPAEDPNPLPAVDNLDDDYLAFQVKAFQLLRNNLATCIESENQEIVPGASLNLWRCNDSNSQKFYYQKNSGEIRVQNMDRLCWDVPDSTFEAGVPLRLWECDQSLDQQFDYDLDSFQIKLRTNNQLCVGVLGGLNEDGTQVELQVCEDRPSQKFLMGRAVYIRSLVQDNPCLDLRDESFEVGLSFRVDFCRPQERRQTFVYEPWSGTLRLKSDSNYCFDIKDSIFAEGASLQIDTCNGRPSQRFYYFEENQHFYSLADPTYCLSSDNESLTQLHECNELMDQRYELLDIFTVEDGPLFLDGEIPDIEDLESQSHPFEAGLKSINRDPVNLCVDVESGVFGRGHLLEISACDGVETQQFLYREEEGSISSVDGDYCWDIAAGRIREGTAVQLWVCNAGESQDFIYDRQSYQVKSKVNPSLCVTINEGLNRDGTRLFMEPCRADDPSQEILLSQDAQVKFISLGEFGEDICYDITGSNFLNNPPLQVLFCKNEEIAQRFAYEFWTGTFRTVHEPDYCMYSDGVGEGSRLRIQECNNLIQQKFFYNFRTKSIVSISNPDLCASMIVLGNRYSSRVELATCNGEIEQQVDLIDPL